MTVIGAELGTARGAGPVGPVPGSRPAVNRRSVLRYSGMPLALVLASLLLYVWVHGHTLDSIEGRLLNATLIRESVLRHLQLVIVSTAIVVAMAVPLGVLLTRPFARPLVPVVVGFANVGQTIPSLGVLVLLAILVGVGFWPVIVALTLYAFLPVLRNTMVGLRHVDPAVIEAGRGMGMTRWKVLWRIELPLAVPILLAGVRTAMVINVGTATIAVLINAGGMGSIIFDGIVQNRSVVLIAGSVMTAILALAVDYVAGIAEEVLSPRGL